MPAYKYFTKDGKTKWYANFYYEDWLGKRGSLTVEYKKKCSQALWYLLFLCQLFCFIL